MNRKLHWDNDLLRPTIYQVFTRFIIFWTGVELLAFLLTGIRAAQVRQVGFGLCALFCAAMAWMAWLRLDGLRLARFDRKLFRRRKKPMRGPGDMIDYVDEDIILFDDLDEEEQDTVLVVANAVTFALLLIMMFIRG